MATINQKGTAQITDNFSEEELRSGSWDAPESWELSDAVINAVQYLRDWSGEPIRITSTLRTPAHNALVQGSKSSLHLDGRAIDFQWTDKKTHDEMVSRLRRGLTCMGEHPDGNVWATLYNILGNKGGGFGWYETFLHIDDRGGEGDDAVMWDLSNNKYDGYLMNTAFNKRNLDDPLLCSDNSREGKKKSGLRRLLESIFARGSGAYAQDGILAFYNELLFYLGIVFFGVTATLVYRKIKK